MKKALSMLLIVGWLLMMVPSSSHAQGDPQASPADWEIALYDISAREIVIVRADGVETLTAPECFTASTEPTDYLEPRRGKIALSPDYRYLVTAIPTGVPGILIADMETGACFEASVDLPANEAPPAAFALDIAIFSPDGTQLAFSYGTYGFVGKILIVNLVESPGTVRHTVEWEGWPLLDSWRTDGLYALSSCVGCSPQPMAGELRRWDPATGAVTLTDEIFTRVEGDILPVTGETLLTTEQRHEYPIVLGPDTSNLVQYTSGAPNKTQRIVYYDPEAGYLPRAVWVLDGNAFFIEHTLVFRDSSTLPVSEGVCSEVIAGTPDGWLAQDGKDIYHCQVEQGVIVPAITDVVLSFPAAVLLRQSPLGATAEGEVIQVPLADKFRLSFCGTPSEASRLGWPFLHSGHVTTTDPQPLYSAPDVNSPIVSTFTTFQMVIGPFCADSDTIWGLIEVGDQKGWALERSRGQQLLEADCSSEGASSLSVGTQVIPPVIHDGRPAQSGAILFSAPYQEELGEIEAEQTVTVLDGPVCDGEHVWWLVDYQGQEGWIME